MNNWTKITGLEANRIAEEQHIARPGTFNGIVLRWIGHSEPPSFVKITGSVQCLSCSRSIPFQMEGMSGQASCAGCRIDYSLFYEECDVDGARSIILVASVHARLASVPAFPPAIDVTDVRPC